MRKGDPLGLSLLPAVAITAGLMGTAGLARPAIVQGPVAEQVTASVPAAEAPRSDDSDSSLKDVRPVMELLAETLGVQGQPGSSSRESKSLESELERPHVTGALINSLDPDAELHKQRASRARETSSEDDEQLRCRLIKKAGESPRFDVQFLIATIPDYVDSNSGWMADQMLSAIQSAMSREGFSLERFRLIDWARREPGKDSVVVNESRLHERQPGALIFSKVEVASAAFPPAPGDAKPTVVAVRVVLLALETPTGGIHTPSLRAAKKFIEEWEPKPARLQIIGPTFSGSIRSLASAIGGAHLSTVVISGSANADSNPEVMHGLAPGVTFLSTVHPSSADMDAIAGFFEERNMPSPAEAALLVESNTSFGAGASQPKGGEGARLAQVRHVFRFPLHVAELLNDAKATAPAISILPSTAIPLSLRETTPPSDQIPTLRPQTTSASAAATVDMILDSIRHLRLRAIGIVATDERDVLFLAREVKRAVPDVQLFIPGGHLIYLHPDYMPYMRGTIVASTYPLSLSGQNDSGPRHSEGLAFPSMIAEGAFNATLAHMALANSPVGSGRSDWRALPAKLIDYCAPNASASKEEPGCTPDVWLSVIGDDGFWPIGIAAPKWNGASDVMIRDLLVAPHYLRPAPMPTRSQLAMVLLLAAVTLHGAVLVMFAIRTRRFLAGNRRKEELRALLNCWMTRWLAAPVTFPSGVLLHSVAAATCMITVGCLGFWQLAVLAGQFPSAHFLCAVLAVVVLVLAVALSLFALKQSGELRTVVLLPKRCVPRAASLGPGSYLGLLVLAGLFYSLWGLVMYSWQTYLSSGREQTQVSLDVARTLGGGMVSPAAGVLCLVGAFYTPMLWSIRRLSFVGVGYTALARNSPAFRLLVGAPQGPCTDETVDKQEQPPKTASAKLAGCIDMPLAHLPWPTCAAIALAMVLIVIGIRDQGSTIEGIWFARFLYMGSVSALAAAILMLAQAYETWTLLKPKLCRLAQTPLAPAFDRVAKMAFRWDLTLVPARLSDLLPLISTVESLRGLMLGLTPSSAGFDRRRPDALETISAKAAFPTDLVRMDDIHQAASTLNSARVEDLRSLLSTEIATQKNAPLLQSHTWFRLWRLSDSLVSLMDRARWSRSEHVAQLPERLARRDNDKDLGAREADENRRTVFFDTCETLLALQFAFVFRDILSRVASGLFAVAVTVALVTAAHLMLVFQGRSSFLLLDVFVIAGTAFVSTSVLICLERDNIISRLRDTTPGRLTFNWQFMGQMVVYGVLPLVAILASIFPDLGESFCGIL